MSATSRLAFSRTLASWVVLALRFGHRLCARPGDSACAPRVTCWRAIPEAVGDEKLGENKGEYGKLRVRAAERQSAASAATRISPPSVIRIDSQTGQPTIVADL